ncbi:hypothetical protein JL720_3628 [Aureococcus anophagefferens]|nr:hypothetical protein JL720_3628 [Aureococcus anophagefferens]
MPPSPEAAPEQEERQRPEARARSGGILEALPPNLFGVVLEHLCVEDICDYCCVAKLFDRGVAYVTNLEMRTVANVNADRDPASHALWQPTVWLRFQRVTHVTLAIESPAALLHFASVACGAPHFRYVELFLSFGVADESEAVDERFGHALRSLAAALHRGALPRLESLTVHCFNRHSESVDSEWTTRLAAFAGPDALRGLAALARALPPMLGVVNAVEWTLPSAFVEDLLRRAPALDLSRHPPGGGPSAVLEAGADPDEGRCCGPPLLMGSGVWHDGDVLCPCCWLDRTPAGALDPDLPSRRAKILAALLDAGADPARTHAAAPGLTAARGVLRHLRTLADDRRTDDDDDAAARLQDLGFSALVPGGDDDVGIDRHGACEKNHLQGGRVGYTKALFAMAAHITAAVERRAAAAAAPPAKKKRTKKRKREGDVATTIASRTRARGGGGGLTLLLGVFGLYRAGGASSVGLSADDQLPHITE